MRTTPLLQVFVIACALTTWSCSGGAMPASPSLVNTSAAPGAGGGRLRAFEDATPMAVIISIVSSFGSGAFMPNPTMASMGDQIVFTNNDAVLHHIVLDDGTDLGDVLPGASSAPMPLATPTATFHCTLHPSMVGSINAPLQEDPYYPPAPPADDYYGY